MVKPHTGDYGSPGDTHSSPESQGGEPRKALEESEQGLKVEKEDLVRDLAKR